MPSHMITTFYRGRPTRGAKLQPIGRVVWDYTFAEDGRAREPFLRGARVPVYVERGLHRIDRRTK